MSWAALFERAAAFGVEEGAVREALAARRADRPDAASTGEGAGDEGADGGETGADGDVGDEEPDDGTSDAGGGP